MQVAITRIDESLPLPKYHTTGSVGFDLMSRMHVAIGPKCLARIPLNIIVQTPPGYVLLVTLRSSFPFTKGITIPHGVGIIDQDYCGPEDELQLQVLNRSAWDTCEICKGDRVAQGLFVPVARVEWDERIIEATSRGGFGSTGSGIGEKS